MKIGIDFDGVIADTTHLKLEVAEMFFGVRVAANRFKEELVIADGVMTREQYRTIMHEICFNEETGLRMKPCPDAISCINELLRDGHTITVITSRDENEVVVAKKWCALQGIELPFISVGYNTAKTDAVRDAFIDAYMDDDIHKLMPMKGIVPKLFVYSADMALTAHSRSGFVCVDWKIFCNELKKR